MALSGGPEAAAEAVAATLAAHFNAYVTKVRTAYGDGTPLPNLASANIYGPKRQALLPDYPSLVVTSLDGSEDEDGAPNWGMNHHRLDVTIYVKSDTIDNLNKQVLRYIWALWDCLKNNQALDGSLSGLSGLTWRKYGRSEVYKDPGKPDMMMAAGAEVIVHIVESTF